MNSIDIIYKIYSKMLFLKVIKYFNGNKRVQFSSKKKKLDISSFFLLPNRKS